MSIHKVVLTEAEEKYAPPGKEIELAVVGENVFITVFSGSDDNIPSTKKKEYEVPVLNIHDLFRSLSLFLNPAIYNVGGYDVRRQQ